LVTIAGQSSFLLGLIFESCGAPEKPPVGAQPAGNVKDASQGWTSTSKVRPSALIFAGFSYYCSYTGIVYASTC